MIIDISEYKVYLAMAVAGFCTGVGTSLANYFMNKHLITRMEKINKKITNSKVVRKNRKVYKE